MVQALSGRKVVKSYLGLRSHMLSVGSIIEQSTGQSIIWGSGFHNDTDVPISRPYHIASVRGPLTRNRLQELGISCPELYGDPALLLPLVYKPKIVAIKDRIGIVLHRSHKDFLYLFKDMPNAFFINIETDDVEGFIDSVCSCEMVISSSLHGLIGADVYKVPNLWIDFNRDSLNRFKFLDYYSSLGIEENKPFLVESSEKFNLESLFSRAKYQNIPVSIQESIKNAFEDALRHI